MYVKDHRVLVLTPCSGFIKIWPRSNPNYRLKNQFLSTNVMLMGGGGGGGGQEI